MTVGERIRKQRKAAGFTQAQLAEKSGVATITIHQYEAGKRQPRLAQIQRLADALNCTPNDLIEDWDKIDPEDAKDALIFGGQIARVSENMSRMTLEGRNKVETYSIDILKVPEYRLNPDPGSTQDGGEDQQ